MLAVNKQVAVMVFVLALGLGRVYGEENKVYYPWLDVMHADLVNSVDSTAVWFDDFFALEEFPDNQSAKGEARIRLGWEPRSRDLNEFDTRFKVKFKLPNLKNRVDVVLSDYDDEQTDNTSNVLQNEDSAPENRFSLALRWKSRPDSGFSHRIGLGRKLQVFAKSRYRQFQQLTQKTSFRWETAGYLYSKDGLGAEVSGQFGYNVNASDLIRFNNHFYYRDKTNDWLWQHNWQYLRQLDRDNAMIGGIYFEGHSRPDCRLDEYSASVRWRKNTLREWLFFEVEPFVLWRRDENFSASYGLALRVEGYFGKF